MTPEDKSIQRLEEILAADAEVISRGFEEKYNAEKIIEIANQT